MTDTAAGMLSWSSGRRMDALRRKRLPSIVKARNAGFELVPQRAFPRRPFGDRAPFTNQLAD